MGRRGYHPRTYRDYHPRIWRAVLDKTGGHCAYCGCHLRVTRTFPNHANVPEILGDYLGSYEAVKSSPWTRSASIDHFVAASKGGVDELSNLVPACMKCNQLKKDHSLERFRWIVALKRRDAPLLSTEQIIFLDQAGFDLGAYLPLTPFWFEKVGLRIEPEEY